jgi:hypothetical protein
VGVSEFSGEKRKFGVVEVQRFWKDATPMSAGMYKNVKGLVQNDYCQCASLPGGEGLTSLGDWSPDSFLFFFTCRRSVSRFMPIETASSRITCACLHVDVPSHDLRQSTSSRIVSDSLQVHVTSRNFCQSRFLLDSARMVIACIHAFDEFCESLC